MRERLAALMGLPLDLVSVKASSNNGIGAIGRVEGIAALAVVSLVPAGGVRGRAAGRPASGPGA